MLLQQTFSSSSLATIVAMDKETLVILSLFAFSKYSALAAFTCTEVGRFSDLTDSTCQNYYVCSKTSNGTFTSKLTTCTSTKLFDPNKSKCSFSYDCEIESISTSNNITVVTQATVVDFTCQSAGRFQNPNDATCKTYYLCSATSKGFIKTLYQCPSVSVFDPDLHVCSTTHVCTPSITTISRTTSEISTESIMTTLISSSTSTQISTTSSDECPTTDPDVPDLNFRCMGAGRWKNGNDTSCTWYFLCNLLESRRFLRTPYKCPGFSLFNPESGMCSLTYNCLL